MQCVPWKLFVEILIKLQFNTESGHIIKYTLHKVAKPKDV